MGVFDRWFGRKMTIEQVRDFVQQERSARDQGSKDAVARLEACRAGALGRLDANAPQGSLSSVVRMRLSESAEQSAGYHSLTHLAQVVRDGLDLCAQSPVSGGVRQILVSFEPALAGVQDAIEREKGLAQVEEALAAFDGMQQKRDEREREVAELESAREAAQARLDAVRVSKDRVVKTPELAKIKVELANVGVERKEVKAEIERVFEPVLPLFARSDHPLLTRYVEDPVKALSSDFSLAVIKESQVLAHSMRKEGRMDTVALSQIQGLQQAILAPLVHRYAQARRSEERLVRELEALPMMQEFSAVLKEQRACEQALDELAKKRAGLVIPDEREVRNRLAAALRTVNVVLI